MPTPRRETERPLTDGGTELALSTAEQAAKEGDGSVGEGVSDLLQAAAYSTVRKPLDGVSQVLRQAEVAQWTPPDIFDKPEHETGWTAAGNFMGSVLDYYALSKTVGGAFDVAGVRNNGLLMSGLEQATAGLLYEGMMPVSEENYAEEKRNNMLLGGITFGAMGMGSAAIDRYGTRLFGDAATRSLWGDVAVGTTSGFAGGSANYLANSWLTGEPLNFYDGARTVGQWSVFGGAMHGLDHGVTNGVSATRDWMATRSADGKPIIGLGRFGVYERAPVEERFQQILRNQDEMELLKHQATHDGLTGLKNKATGEELLLQEVERAKREGQPLSAIVMDLDGFKAVNDHINHEMGDEALRAVSRVLKQNFDRGTDILIRNGGDEFLVLLPNTPLGPAQKLAQQVQSALRISVNHNEARPLQPHENALEGERAIGVSVGTVEWRPGETGSEFLNRGDELATADKQARKKAGLARERGE